MTSKGQPAADFWTDDVKMTSNVQPAAGYWTADWETWGRASAIFVKQKKKELIFSCKSWKIFD